MFILNILCVFSDLDDENNQASSTSYTQMNQSLKRAFPNLDNNSDEANVRVKRPQQVQHHQPQLDDFDGHTTLSPTPFGLPHHMPIIPEVSTSDLHRDKHAIFGEYIAEVLRRLPNAMQPQTTLKMMNVIIEAQEQELQSQTSPATVTTQSTTENGGK